VNRYTTKHQWRMTESEQGEWVRYEDYNNATEILRSERDSYREFYREAHNDYCNMTKEYYKEQRLADYLETRVRALCIVLMATYGGIVAELIVWSFGL